MVGILRDNHGTQGDTDSLASPSFVLDVGAFSIVDVRVFALNSTHIRQGKSNQGNRSRPHTICRYELETVDKITRYLTFTRGRQSDCRWQASDWATEAE